MDYQHAEVSGIVKSITIPKTNTEPTRFKIYLPNSKKTMDAVCDFFCPIRQGDTIYALCIFRNNILYLNRPPFVQPAIDKESLVQCFMKALRQGYGPSTKLYRAIEDMADGEENIIGFLSSTAQQWTDTRNIDILHMFSGTEPENIKKILNWWHKERNLRRLFLFGLTKKEINAARMTCDVIYEKCIENPYTVPSIPLEKCDMILDMLNKKPEADEKIRGSIVRMIWKNLNDNGWTGTPSRIVRKQYSNIKDHIEILKSKYDVVVDKETVYLTFPYKVETWFADYIVNKHKEDVITYDTPLDIAITLESGKVIKRDSAIYKFSASDDQKKAIQGALDHTICAITGPPGTGKSKAVGGIIENLEIRGVKYAVCAFTGKAVSRLREITGKKTPCTIHKLISNSKRLKATKKDQFEKDVIFDSYEHVVVDEASMVTTELMYDLIKAYPDVKKLTFVGDCNQLSPIGWGSLFHQLLKSNTIPVYKLLTNFRVYTATGEKDGIIANANAMIAHDPMFPFEFIPATNFSVMEGAIDRVYDIVFSCFESGIKVDQVVVITPYNKTLPILNKKIQEIFNIGAPFTVDSRGVKWMIGDRVMLLENDQTIGVFNGENGIIKELSEKCVLVDFGSSGSHEFLLEPSIEPQSNQSYNTKKKYHQGQETDVVYEEDDDFSDERTVIKLIHSYALTIDKSQGSEWDFVIVYIPEFNSGSFMNTNRIYTSFTRAKRCCWEIVSDIDALNLCAIKKPPVRYENLALRLQEKLPNLPMYKSTKAIDDPLTMNGDLPRDYLDTGFDCDDY